ncbi:hypothetical protein [Pseudomonas sp. PSE1(2024)]|uniref:hypothetical protein n=1 Tax=Pseudomonas sp. PSE1(2024) TaxID=3228746 RepID=UPI003D965925
MSEENSRIKEAKDVEFYAAAINAWMTTKFELDKSLLTLSAGGIGLIITLISTVGVRSIESLILSLLSMICFLVTLSCVLGILSRNAKYIQDSLLANGPASDPVLAHLDRIAVTSFMAGVILASVIGISTAANAYIDKAAKMSEKTTLTGSQVSQESLDLMANLRQTSNKSNASAGQAANTQAATAQSNQTSQTAQNSSNTKQ